MAGLAAFILPNTFFKLTSYVLLLLLLQVWSIPVVVAVVIVNIGVIYSLRKEKNTGINIFTSAIASVFSPTILPEQMSEKERTGTSSVRLVLPFFKERSLEYIWLKNKFCSASGLRKLAVLLNLAQLPVLLLASWLTFYLTSSSILKTDPNISLTRAGHLHLLLTLHLPLLVLSAAASLWLSLTFKRLKEEDTWNAEIKFAKDGSLTFLSRRLELPAWAAKASVPRWAKLLVDLLLVLLTVGSLAGSLASLSPSPARVFLVARDAGRVDLLEATTLGNISESGLSCNRNRTECGDFKIVDGSHYNTDDASKIIVGEKGKGFLTDVLEEVEVQLYSRSSLQTELQDDTTICVRKRSVILFLLQ